MLRLIPGPALFTGSSYLVVLMPTAFLLLMPPLLMPSEGPAAASLLLHCALWPAVGRGPQIHLGHSPASKATTKPSPMSHQIMCSPHDWQFRAPYTHPLGSPAATSHCGPHPGWEMHPSAPTCAQFPPSSTDEES